MVTQETMPANPTAESLIAHGIEKGMSVETMEKLMAMRRELKLESGKEAFDQAMSHFQAECPVITKGKEVKGKDKVTTRYKYAPLEYIIEQTRSLREKHGFSHSFDTEIVDKDVKVFCKVKHKLGHSEVSQFKVPTDPEAYMNAPQKFASAMTYAKRYAFCNAFGITLGDEDTDAADIKAPKDSATDEQKQEISDLAQQAGMTASDVSKRCQEKYGVSFTKITSIQANGIIDGLKKRIASMGN